MKYLTKKLSLLTSTLVALSFLMAVTLSSCGGSSDYSDDDADTTEAVEESAESTDEHPAAEGDEQPASDSEEHPSDSTAVEHPEGDDTSSDSDES